MSCHHSVLAHLTKPLLQRNHSTNRQTELMILETPQCLCAHSLYSSDLWYSYLVNAPKALSFSEPYSRPHLCWKVTTCRVQVVKWHAKCVGTNTRTHTLTTAENHPSRKDVRKLFHLQYITRPSRRDSILCERLHTQQTLSGTSTHACIYEDQCTPPWRCP